MDFKEAGCGGCVVALRTFVGTNVEVFPPMDVELAVCNERCVTEVAGVRSFPSVQSLMSCMGPVLVECLGAVRTLVWFLSSVTSVVNLFITAKIDIVNNDTLNFRNSIT